MSFSIKAVRLVNRRKFSIVKNIQKSNQNLVCLMWLLVYALAECFSVTSSPATRLPTFTGETGKEIPNKNVKMTFGDARF